MTDTLLLIDDPSNINELLSKFSNNNKTKIICFEVEDHKILSELHIPHEIIENYIDYNDRKSVEQLALEKALGWYTQEATSEFLQIKNINLGWLLEVEIYQYLLQTMRNFIGIIKIIEKEKPSKVFASENLSSMIKSINSEKQIDIFLYSKKEQSDFYFDRVEIPIKIGNKQLTLKTSRNFALKIKKVTETITDLIFRLKYHNQQDINTKSILLMEFNPIFYVDFLTELTSLGIKIILLNERRPAVWNFESLNIVKKLDCKILHLDNVDPEINQKIMKEKKEFQKKLQKMFFNNDFFKKFFSLNGYTFWPSIKNYFISTCSQRFDEALRRIELSIEFFKKKKIKLLVTMYDAGAEERAILSVAKAFGVSGILLQHGIYAQNQYMQKFLPFLGYLPILGLKEAVWGNETRNYLDQMGIKKNDIILSGSLRHDNYFQNNKKKSVSNKILLATNVIMGLDFSGFDIQVHTNFQKTVKEICKITNKIPEKKLVVKLHPGKSPIDNIEKIISNLDPKIPIYKSGNIFDYIKDCEVLISTEWSTVLLEAMILGIPTITFLSDPKGFEDEKIIQSGATALVKTTKEFEKTLNDILFDEKFREEIISRGQNYVDKYMINQGTASKFLATNIKQNYFNY